MADFRNETVVGLAEQVARREVSARELAAAALERIELLDGELGAFVALQPERAMAEADAVDERLAAGEDVGPLAGIPIGVKDLEDAIGYVTTHGSVIDAGNRPAESDSLLVSRLRRAGCVVVGKTNTPELGYRPDTVNNLFGATKNPWDLARSPGGSSGGSAAAVAAGLVPLATGSDGGGSIRIPSSLCGLTGHKPSLGRLPTGAEVPEWLDLSTRGPMALRIADVAFVLDQVVGPEPSDFRSLPRPDESWYEAVQRAERPRRVGWSPTLGYGSVDTEVRAACDAAVEVLAGLGTEVVPVDRVFDSDPVWSWLPISTLCVERSIGGARETDEWSRVDADMVGMLDLLRDSSPTDLIRAFDGAHRAAVRLAEVFAEHEIDLLLTPTVAGQTPRSGEQGTIDGVPNVNWVQFTYPFNLTRSPAGTVTAGFTADGMPIGLQVVGPLHDDVGVLRCLAVLEEALALDRTAPFG
jgi:Asp-tRNA(Asn)/Glu-tRNA(Gln) amidotransferase A subunit family amidase